MKSFLPSKVSILLSYLYIAPPYHCAELLIKLLVPLSVKVSAVCSAKIAPPLRPAELLMKLLVPFKVSPKFTLPFQCAKLLMRLLVPMKPRFLSDM